MQISSVFVSSYSYCRISKMSSQESVGESRVSHPTPGPGTNSDAYHFGPSTEDEMEAGLKRIDAMEEDQEVTSRLQAECMMGELPSLAIPNSVIPSNFRFLSYENMKKSITCSPEAMQHPWVKGALPLRASSVKKLWTSNNKSISSRRRTVS